MVELFSMRVQAGVDLSKTFPTRNLSVRKAKELIECGKLLYPVFSPIPVDADIEVMAWEKLEQLPENGMARVHGYLPKLMGRYHQGQFQIEKRTIVSKNNKNQLVTEVQSKFTGQ